MEIELILTRDGSHSLLNSSLNETYHSTHGAFQESTYIYIEQGLKPLTQIQKNFSILEIGFGTGLNAILTLQEAIVSKLEVKYTTLEPFPLTSELVNQLNYPEFFSSPYLREIFKDMHLAEWENWIPINQNFSIIKKKLKLEELETYEKFDLVYFDAFAPSKQPDIWSLSNLVKVKKLLRANGILITYCSSSQFKKDLKQAGFEVESLPGPIGKREITRATASQQLF